MTKVWLLATSGAEVSAQLAAVRELGPVTVLAVGSREVAEQAAACGPDAVRWCQPAEGVPVEACAAAVADAAAQAEPDLVAAGGAPQARALLGAVAARLGATLLPGVSSVAAKGGEWVVERSAVGAAVVQTLRVSGRLAVVLEVADEGDAAGSPAPIEELPLAGTAPVRVSRRASATASGLADATKVVAVGRGLRARADMALGEQLAAALGAEIACSMPIADDLGWVEKSRYIGRSGQSITPRLYLAIGISGAPQHLEGIRGAKVVAAVDIDPDAPIFRRATYGIAGDLYEVVPAIIAALSS
ncbi:MAG: electron transfer flavoprotein subunit alpha/FixB family protein [Actinomycetia bacterium]|nr:electron transfer flavoprotein subunit alpha/FixB family protein [Actinomycetes bacterium]